MDKGARGVALVSAGSLILVVMATVVKHLGTDLPAMEILFFPRARWIFFILPIFARDPMEPWRTKRFGMHFVRGATGALGNALFFWTLTHMLLADAMALQFSRPLFMLPLAVFFLGEVAGWRRSMVAVVGFLGIMLYARPFTAGFEPSAFVGARGGAGGRAGRHLHQAIGEDRADACHHVLLRVLECGVRRHSRGHIVGHAELGELALLIVVGFLGISGQSLITHGLSLGDATVLVPLDYSRIVYSAALGYVLFGELPGLWSVAGMALIVAASLYLVLTEKKRVVPVAANP